MIVQRQMNGTPYTILVPSDDVHGLYMAENGQHDEAWKYTLDLIKSGDLVMDVGAHLGLFSLLACSRGARVVAIEPAPSNLECLRRLTDINPGLNLTVVEAAASDKNGSIRFVPRGPHGHVALGSEDSIEVTSVRLDELNLKEEVALIKIDVEGYELAVLEGMRGRGWWKVPLPLLLCESNGHTLHRTGASPSDLRLKIESLGYQCFRLHKDALVPAPATEIQPECVVDLLAAPAGRITTRPKLSFQEIDSWIDECKQSMPALGPDHESHLKRELTRFGRS